MRRLPIYFLIDVSESMVGDPIACVQEGMAAIIKELRTDPYALETVYISVIVFAGRAKKLTPLMELHQFYLPNLSVGGGTALGEGLEFLMNDMDASLVRTTREHKGDWKPIVFLFTDGAPTDSPDAAFERWNQRYRMASSLIAISIGNNPSAGILKKITDNVLELKNTDPRSFNRFFKWITASIKAVSTSINELSGDELKLSPFSDDLLKKIEMEVNQPIAVDEQVAVFLSKCAKTERPYLVKYRKRPGFDEFASYLSNPKKYELEGAYPINNEYFELADVYQTGKTVNTSELLGFPSCPCCGNPYGFSICRCGRMMCTGEEEVCTCPWCGMEARFSMAEKDSDINRTRG